MPINDQPFAVNIRRAGLEDAQALALVGQASFLESYAGFLSRSDLMEHCVHQHAVEKYLKWLQSGVDFLWVAEAADGGVPLGYLALTVPEFPAGVVQPGDSEVKRIYMLHRFQRWGLGRRLLEAAEDHARAHGQKRLLLGVNKENEKALAFYQRTGFSIVGNREFRVGARVFNDWILGKPL